MSELKRDINTDVENLFSNLVVRYSLKSGDITPLQYRLTEDFKLMLEEFVNQNVGVD